MRETTPTRSVVLEMKDERRAMQEGYVFLDEKCLVLAREILHGLGRYAALQKRFDALHAAAIAALQAAVGRHGLEGLQVYPVAMLAGDCVKRTSRPLMGVRLQEAAWQSAENAAPSSVVRSPEAEACRRCYEALLPCAAELAAVSGNLERLRIEYRKSVRRARALQDVLLPELDQGLYEMEQRLEELEQEDAIWMRRGAAQAR